MTTRILSLFPPTRRALTAGLIALACLPALATTFTNNAAIGVGDTNYDGTDIVVTNCTLTVDGPHAFSSLRVAAGGVLTHSFYPSGVISNLLFITNESQVLSGTNPVTLLNSNVISATVSVTDSSGTIDYTNEVDYLLTSTNEILTELQRTTNSSIPDGATVLVSYEVLLGIAPAGLNLSVTGNVEVDVGGAINADGKGWGGGLGTGAGYSSAGSLQDGSGAGYGGNGGMSSSNAVGGVTYGSYTQPSNLGSGGGAGYAGPGGAGGGLIEIVAGGSMIANGPISANGADGANSRSGGGSGGSVWLAALALSGSGAITANGGRGEPSHGGGGGGGRIAIQCGAASFAGSMAAYGGAGANIGGAGTVYTKLTGESGLLVIDNGGQSGTNTSIAIGDQTIDVLIEGNAGVMPIGAWEVGNLTIASNSLLLASSLRTITLTAAGVVSIEAGGGLLANAAGYAGGFGPGAGKAYNYGSYEVGGGGGYGGNGAASSPTNGTGGTAYGNQTTPSGFGSGGGMSEPEAIGGSGGGAIEITSLSGLVQVDGTIAANGGNGSGFGGGGGSGGTIVLTGGTLLGSGSISANGGDGANSIGGGGGGGRIALSPAANLFGGTISAYGGGGGNWGGAGTVLLQVPGQNGQNAQLILDNDGHAGTNTPLQSAGSTDLIVRGGAVGSASSSVSFANLYLNTNGWLAPALNYSSPAASLIFSFTGNATVQAGGGIVADFAGYPAGQGPGEGRTAEFGSTNLCSGGGHGGYGGSSFGNYAAGGYTYDYITSPSQPGSGGGMFSGLSPGGSGGGVIRLTVTGTLEMEGLISANGANGSGQAGGGGSGGSIWLAVGAFSGAGSIAANGGSGADALGGGGGGIISISCNNNSFSGTLAAYGGGGANWGGVGPAIIEVSGQNAQVILDGGGHSGPATPLLYSATTDLTLRNGAVGSANSYTTLGNVLVSSNAWLLVTFPSDAGGLECSSATIQTGGGIIADFAGYPAAEGSGAGQSYDESSPPYACSGAGHGGNGANTSGNFALGGNAYDNPTSPSQPGSGGGTYSPYSVGGAGGGALRIIVTGLLQVDGAISANGGNGSGSGGGGGSGGSIWLTAGTLSGTGSITANGGAGAGSIGGGGGGGRLAIYSTANLFGGAISAFGGGGANWGGAGTIAIATTDQAAQFILDNGGQSGAATPIQSEFSTALILRNGAVGYQEYPPQTFASLLVGSNAWLKTNPALEDNLDPGVVNLTVTGNATVAAGGGIVADNAGSAAGSGIGAGHSYNQSYYPCGGGGYGGYGAAGAGNFAGGGLAYGSTTSPTSNGSGGGDDSPLSVGGAGGGTVHLIVNGTLAADGTISANGGNGSGLGGGGGSGGSICLTVGTLAGAGSITANGGSWADAVGGGGGGGRISVGYTANSFVGLMTAYGGGGYAHGGAGTIYTMANAQSVGQLLLDNGGAAGANTPLSSIFGIPSEPFNLTIGNGAIVCPQSSFPLLSNLTVASGGLLTSMPNLTLDLLVFNNLDVAPGGVIAVDGEGFSQAGGLGAGQSIQEFGSGAGYGGAGGASATAPGGATYGSSNQPVDFGSGGGLGYGPPIGGSEGGGALRLSVGGILTVDGQISADGQPGLQDNSGGGSGGSLWVTAGTLAGSGFFTADGGAGELYGGGGGAGGRIALYSRANIFSGLAAASGAGGDFPGADGTLYSNTVPPLQVLSNSPAGIVSNGVSSVVLYFNGAPDPNSFAATAVSLATPNGPLSSGSLSISMLSSASYLVSFPLQTAVGNYVLTVGPGINDLYGQPMPQVYTGAFAISLPVIQGTITDSSGQPVPGVLLQPSAGLSSTTTDTNGNYDLGFVPGSSFTVTPSQGALLFAPVSMSYTNVSTSISNQNYLAYSTIAPVLTAAGNATNLVLGWQAIAGVNYQIYSSTNLSDWLPYGSAFTASNGPVQILVPTGGPGQFFSVQSSN